VTPDEFLGRVTGEGDEPAFAFGRHLHGAFGGVFGGALAAATVTVARDAAPGRAPASLDCRFVRALPAGRARARASVLHGGRSMTTVVVDLVDERDRTTTHSTVTLVDRAALARRTVEVPAPDWVAATADAADGRPWPQPPGFEAPIIDTLKPRAVGTDRGAPVTTAIAVPWDDPDASAEAVCLAADLCVGPPVALACRGTRLAHPNPDLSLRFAAAAVDVDDAAASLVAAGRLVSVDAGVATVAVEVAAGGRVVAVGVSFSVLLEAA
jgi:hypothetical protein